MLLDLLWNGGAQRLDLADGTVTVGGGPADDIRLEGLPHGLLTLTLFGEHVSVMAQRSVRVGDALFPARRARLLVFGEDLKLPNDVVLRRARPEGAVPERATVGTAFVADGLLAGDDSRPSRAATLTCVAGDDAGRVFALPFDEASLGRSPEADVQLTDRLVSRRHARLSRRSSGFVLLPAPDAMNGLKVNGRLVKRERLLSTGDVVELGRTLLRFEEAAAAPAPQAREGAPGGRQEATAVEPGPRARPAPVPPPAPPRPVPGQPSPLLAREPRRVTASFPAAPPGTEVPPALAPALGAPRPVPRTTAPEPTLNAEPIPTLLAADHSPRVTAAFAPVLDRETLWLGVVMTSGGLLALAGAALAAAMLR